MMKEPYRSNNKYLAIKIFMQCQLIKSLQMNSIRISLLQKFYTFTYWKLLLSMLALTKKRVTLRKHLAIKILSLFIALLLVMDLPYSLSHKRQTSPGSAYLRLLGSRPIPITIEDKKNLMPGFVFRDNYSVHVTTGLLKILDTEDQIAGILAHETGHIA